jgi:hypothetical protein
MSFRSDDLAQKRHELTARIARQRDEFSIAYRNIAKPIHYAEQGMKGFSFLRANPWLFSIVPAAFTITSAIVGIVRNQPIAAKKSSFFSKAKAEEKVAEKAPKSLMGHAMKWSGHGWKAYKFYRKFKRFIP